VKIVLAAHHYPPDHTAGVELVTRQMARWLVGRGHDVEVVCVGAIEARQGLTVRTDHQDGVVVHRLDVHLAGQDLPLTVPFQNRAIEEWFAGYLARVRPDIFHGHSSYLLTASPLIAAGRLAIPSVVTLHDYWFTCPRLTLTRSNGEICTGEVTPEDCASCLMAERRRYRLLDAARSRVQRVAHGLGIPAAWWPVDPRVAAMVRERRRVLSQVLRSVDRIVTRSSLNNDLLIKSGIEPRTITMVHHGLDLGGWMGSVRREPRAGLRVGYLGQIAPHKGVHVAVEAIREVARATDQVHLSLHGDLSRFPGYVARLRRSAADSPCITFAGAFDSGRVEAVLAGLDVIVVPSLWHEVSPGVIWEAFAAKVPVIASNLPNLRSMVSHERDGLLFEMGDARDLARQVRGLLSDPGRLERLRAGIKPARTLDEEMLQYLVLYDEVVRTRGASIAI
jgi:glycosyltransferase involved in cell wall biosynthesis